MSIWFIKSTSTHGRDGRRFFKSICQQQPRIRTELSSYHRVERWCKEECLSTLGSHSRGKILIWELVTRRSPPGTDSFSRRTARKYLHYSSIDLKRRHINSVTPLQTAQCPLPCMVGEEAALILPLILLTHQKNQTL